MVKHRLELFTDAVLAIILTIMVLDLHAPGNGTLSAFIPVLPSIGIYILGFVVVCWGWVYHHHFLSHVDTVNRKMVWANFLFLLMGSFVPFLVKTWADYPSSRVDAILLMVLFFLTGNAMTLFRFAAWKDHCANPDFVAWYKLRNKVALRALGLFVVLLVVCRFAPLAAMLIYLASLLWLLSTL